MFPVFKKLVWIFFLLHSSFAYCQDSTSYRRDGYWNLVYGTRLFNKSFYNQLNTLKSFSINSPLQLIGVGWGGGIPVDGRFGSSTIYGHWSYTQVIPQQIKINDSIQGTINGYVLSIDIAGTRVLKKLKYFGLKISTGFNTGRLRLSDNEWVRQKNPFFSPKISIRPTTRIKKIVLSLRCDYEYDISSPRWRRTYFANKNKIDIDKFKETGMTLFFCLTYLYK
jgi:hypothetical protein